jgi:hypothetical protein
MQENKILTKSQYSIQVSKNQNLQKIDKSLFSLESPSDL